MPRKDLRPNSFNFARRRGSPLLSSDFSATAALSGAELARYTRGAALPAKSERLLEEGGFYAGRLDLDRLTERHFASFLAGWQGPKVHIVSVTGDCDHACLYCSAGAGKGGRHMSRATAKRTLDFIFSTGSPELVIEFQGGEPLRNFPVVRYIIEEAGRRAAKGGRRLHFSMVSNLAGLTPEKLEYLASRCVTLCTSLDGPARLHDLGRKYTGGSSHAAAACGIAMVNKLAAAGRLEPVNAICTVTRHSLPHPEKIVDEFLRLGISRVQLGPLEPIGRASGGELAVAPAEFLAFYRRALDYMLKLNGRGVRVYEKGALMFLKQMTAGERPRYQNLDILYRLSYSADGSVYGSDEARLLGAGGSDLLRLGSVDDGFSELVLSPLARTLILSCFPRVAQPRCARCPYSCWCRVPPAYNVAAQGGFWGDMMTSGRCRVFMGVSDLLVKKLREPRAGKILAGWAGEYQ